MLKPNLISCLFILCGLAVCTSELITISYTAKNFLTDDDQMFVANIVLETERKAFIDIMDEAALLDDRFRYTSIEYEGMGHYITSINGVYGDMENEIAWAFLKLTVHGYCNFPVGVSSYYPNDEEHIVFSLEPWDILHTVPTC